MKRPLLFTFRPESALVLAGTGLIAATYGLVRLAYGLFLPDVSASLGLAADTAGRVSSGASLAYCLAALGGLVAADRPRRLVLGAIVTGAGGALTMAVAPDVATFAVGAVVGSAGAGFASPGLVGLVERNVAQPGHAQAQSVVNAGTGPGLVGAAALALVLLPDWRLGLALGGATTLVAGAAVLRLDRSSGTSVPGSSRLALRASTVRRLLVPALGALLLGAASAAVWTYGRTLIVAEGGGEVGSTLAWAALGLGGTVSVATARRLAVAGPPRAWLLSTAAVALASVVLGLGGGHLTVAVMACALFGWGFVAASSVLISWCVLVAPQLAAAGTSVLFVMLVLGQAVGSAAVGAFSGDHLPGAFVAAAGVALLAAVCGTLPVRAGAREALVRPTGPG